MSKLKIKILQKGDSVISVTERMIAVKRKNGEVDIIPILLDESPVRVDTENIVTITYGTNAVETVLSGEHGNVTVSTF